MYFSFSFFTYFCVFFCCWFFRFFKSFHIFLCLSLLFGYNNMGMFIRYSCYKITRITLFLTHLPGHCWNHWVYNFFAPYLFLPIIQLTHVNCQLFLIFNVKHFYFVFRFVTLVTMWHSEFVFFHYQNSSEKISETLNFTTIVF